jgi:1,4-alpha-glucan branching enzyme
MPEGYVVIVLHAHLPYVLSHGKWPHGSDWLCEAACETYIPLLNLLSRLAGKGKHPNLTLGITPVLCEMLASPAFRSCLYDYVSEKMMAASADRKSFGGRGEDEMALLAARWQDFYRQRLADFTDAYGGTSWRPSAASRTMARSS